MATKQFMKQFAEAVLLLVHELLDCGHNPKTENTTPVAMISAVAARIGLSPLLNFDFGRSGRAAAFLEVLGSIQSDSNHR